MDWTEEAWQAIEKDAYRRIRNACIECVKDLKQIVSVPAPRRVAKSGRIYAATPAIPGAPPRKLTGIGRASLAYQVDRGSRTFPEVTGRVGTNIIYMRVHEWSPPGIPGLHRYVEPTLTRNRKRYETILMG